MASLGFAAAAGAAPGPVVWTLGDLKQVGGVAPTVWGAPQARADGSVHFNGASDGLMLPLVPLAGWEKFTVAVLFRPQAGGPAEQRFVHSQDQDGGRLTIGDPPDRPGNWALDTFLANRTGQRTLLDRTKLHPVDQWAWAELVYDGHTMTSYVNGVRELTGAVAFAPMVKTGHTALGVRLNQIYWFKGQIREVRFYPVPLAAADLPRVP